MSEDLSGLRTMARQAMRAEMLDADTELRLARAWRDDQCEASLHRLVNAYMRLAVSMAAKYRRYGAQMPDLVQEAGVGLMKAAEKFDPDRGVRFSTYAVWWIKASIQEYVLRSWSLVKMGTTANQKRLFFNLRKAKNRIQALGDGDLNEDQVKQIATDLQVTEEDVRSMNQRLSGDASLNAPMRAGEGESGQWQDWLVDESDSQEKMLIEEDETDQRRALLKDAMDVLNDREKRIFTARRLSEEPLTLEELSGEFSISRERVRQIEVRAFEKVQEAVQAAAAAVEKSTREAIAAH